MNKNPTML